MSVVSEAYDPAFTIDGSPHTGGDKNCEGCSPEQHRGHDRWPADCDGLIHETAVYGPAFMVRCDLCGFHDVW